jgi:hypothetical protein
LGIIYFVEEKIGDYIWMILLKSRNSAPKTTPASLWAVCVEEISYLAEFIDKSPRISKEYPILRDSNLFKLLFLVFDKVVNKDLLKMKKIKDLGLTPNQGELQSLLEYKKIKIIKRKEMVSLISKFKISKNPKYLIKSMLQKKRLVFFKRGHYIVIPVSSFDKTVGIDEFELNERFLESDEYYIGLYNAFNLHGG